MKLTVKDIDIATGGPLIVIIHKEDAQLLDLHPKDRILLKKGSKKTVVVVDIAESDTSLKCQIKAKKGEVACGTLGCFEEVMIKLKLKDGDVVELAPAHKPRSLQFIKKKLLGKKLDDHEMDVIVNDIVRDELTENELTYFVSGCFSNGLSTKETVALTQAIVNHGKKLDVCENCVVDKHCIGGVPGNRTTMLVVPILAAAGYLMPKTSSRSITSPAGTADTMEVLCSVTHPVRKMKSIIRKVGGCITWGGGVNLAAADDKLIRVRHPLSIDPEGMLLASILAKKKAVGAHNVLLDIPVGEFAKIKTQSEAINLKKKFLKVGRRLGMNVHVVITNGDQPIGNGIGPALEARDVLYILRRDPRAPKDLEKKSIDLAARLFKISGVKNPHKFAREILEDGRAYAKFKQIIDAQGGDPNVDPDKIAVGKLQQNVLAHKSGRVKKINNKIISRIARMAGSPMDKEAGLFMHVKLGDKVKKGQPLFTIYAKNKANMHFAKKTWKLHGGIQIR